MEITSKGALVTIGCKGSKRCMVRGFLLEVLASLRDEVYNILLHVRPIEAFSGQTSITVYPQVSYITM